MDINFATMGAGVLHITTLAQLPAVLKMASPLNLSGTYPSLQQEQDAAAAINKKQGSAGGASIATSASTLSLTAVIKLLDSFPGPLNPSSSKDKCVKFIKDRLANCQLDELPTDAPAWQVDARKALWDLLLLLASNQGQLKSTSGSSAGSKAAAAVGNLLKGAVGAAAAAAGDGAASPSAAGIAAGKAAAGADVGSPRAAGGESELLRILAPGAAAGSAAGQRVLATAVPEVELQATAAEMQVGVTFTSQGEESACCTYHTASLGVCNNSSSDGRYCPCIIFLQQTCTVHRHSPQHCPLSSVADRAKLSSCFGICRASAHSTSHKTGLFGTTSTLCHCFPHW